MTCCCRTKVAVGNKFFPTHDTAIGYGHMKGCKHIELLLEENAEYAAWIAYQEDYQFTSTQEYVLENIYGIYNSRLD